MKESLNVAILAALAARKQIFSEKPLAADESARTNRIVSLSEFE